MQPLESVDLESRAVTERAARRHADLVEQVVGLHALAAAHLVADGDERVPLRPGVAEPRLVLPRGTPHSAVSWVEGGGAAVTRVRARDGPDIDKDVEKELEQDIYGDGAFKYLIQVQEVRVTYMIQTFI